MKVTLLDEKGVELTEITAHVGRSRGQILVDWASRPDALFRYYVDGGRRSVILVNDATQHPALLGARWQMGARFWFLHAVVSGSLGKQSRTQVPAPEPAPHATHAHRSTSSRGAANVAAAIAFVSQSGGATASVARQRLSA